MLSLIKTLILLTAVSSFPVPPYLEPTIHVINDDGCVASLPREIFINEKNQLIQRFDPKLKTLRRTIKPVFLVCCGHAGSTSDYPVGLNPIELIVHFPKECGSPPIDPNVNPMCGVEILGDGNDWGLGKSLLLKMDTTMNLMTLNGTTLGDSRIQTGEIPPPNMEADYAWTVHVFVDKSIIELIINNQTTFLMYVEPKINSVGNIRVFGSDGLAADIWTLSKSHDAGKMDSIPSSSIMGP